MFLLRRKGLCAASDQEERRAGRPSRVNRRKENASVVAAEVFIGASR